MENRSPVSGACAYTCLQKNRNLINECRAGGVSFISCLVIPLRFLCLPARGTL